MPQKTKMCIKSTSPSHNKFDCLLNVCIQFNYHNNNDFFCFFAALCSLFFRSRNIVCGCCCSNMFLITLTFLAQIDDVVLILFNSMDCFLLILFVCFLLVNWIVVENIVHRSDHHLEHFCFFHPLSLGPHICNDSL